MLNFSQGVEPYAQLQYAGLPGISSSCLKAVQRFIQFGDHIESATLLTHDHSHAMALVINEGETIIVKNGFSSGYAGEGPSCLAKALATLRAVNAEIDEVLISRSHMRKIDASALSRSDWNAIQCSRPIRPMRWFDYIYDAAKDRYEHSRALLLLPETMPWHAIDQRLLDLAWLHQENPDEAIIKGFRRLEDLIRARTSSKEHGTRLFAQAFVQEDSVLTWPDIDPGEVKARGQLFNNTFSAFRNPRAHKENAQGFGLSEFLLLNLLFKLEAQSKERPPSPPEEETKQR